MRNDAFFDYHPSVSMLYFCLVIGFCAVLNHPLCLFISFSCALCYYLYPCKGIALRINGMVILLFALFTAIINPLFSHRGVTILAYLPGGNALTLESILFGISSAFLLVTVILWVYRLNCIVTSDKLIYLIGRAAPSISLMLSMILRFIPRFKTQLRLISNAQRGITHSGKNSGGIINRARDSIKILSALITWALEGSIDSANSMKSRGYGLAKRTSFSLYRLERRDKKALIFLVCAAVIIILGILQKRFSFYYYPSIKGRDFDFLQCVLFIVYFVLCAMPLTLNIYESIIFSPRNYFKAESKNYSKD